MSFQREKSSGIVRGGPPPAVSGGGRTRSSTIEVEELPRFYPELEPSYEASITSGAMRKIREELRASKWLEQAGWLLAHPHDLSRVVLATGVGSDGNPKRSSVSIGFEELEMVERLQPGLALVGDYHQHPSSDRRPSRVDRRAWMRGAELTRSWWYSLIFAPPKDGWSQPECSAYITVRNNGSPFCEPLLLREL
jgi:Prokaryotic homologs of the JAB domain